MKYCTACLKTYPTDQDECPADHTRLQVAHELQPGMIIRNKYQILDRIGVGGMGLVYRGRHLTFNELCAIKIVNDDIAGNANFLKRFQTEAIVTRKLRHPNAVRVDDFDYTEDGRPFIVMELVEGKNISEIIHKEGALAVPRAMRLWALEHPHQWGLIFGTPVPGYHAPEDTIEPYTRMAVALVRPLLAAHEEGRFPRDEQRRPITDELRAAVAPVTEGLLPGMPGETKQEPHGPHFHPRGHPILRNVARRRTDAPGADTKH